MMDNQKQLITEIMNDDAKDGLYKQQTAVEWLEKMIYEQGVTHFFSNRELITKAKQMERKQIEQAYNQGYRDGESDGYMNGDKDISNFSNAHYYYTQTYGE